MQYELWRGRWAPERRPGRLGSDLAGRGGELRKAYQQRSERPLQGGDIRAGTWKEGRACGKAEAWGWDVVGRSSVYRTSIKLQRGEQGRTEGQEAQEVTAGQSASTELLTLLCPHRAPEDPVKMQR